MENHIVIMAGGIGSRLWPMSTPEYPKQFVDVIGCGKSLIQLTVERFLPLCPIQHMWVVTSERYTDIVKEQLPELPESQILAEPEARNTAPCIAYAGQPAFPRGIRLCEFCAVRRGYGKVLGAAAPLY